MKKRSHAAEDPAYTTMLYRTRIVIERFFNRIEHFRRVSKLRQIRRERATSRSPRLPVLLGNS
jgi:transposase